jgi:hypothetical protein
MNKILILMVLLLSLYFLFDSKEYFQDTPVGATTSVSTNANSEIVIEIKNIISRLETWTEVDDEEKEITSFSIFILMGNIFHESVGYPFLKIIVSSELFDNDSDDITDDQVLVKIVDNIKNNLADVEKRNILIPKFNVILKQIADEELIFYSLILIYNINLLN